MSDMLSVILAALMNAVSCLLDNERAGTDAVLGQYASQTEEVPQLTIGEWALVSDLIFYIREGQFDDAANALGEYTMEDYGDCYALVERVAELIPAWHPDADAAGQHWAAKRYEKTRAAKELYEDDPYDGGEVDFEDEDATRITVSLKASLLQISKPRKSGVRIYKAHKWVWPVFDPNWARESIERKLDGDKINGLVVVPTILLQDGDQFQRVYSLNKEYWPKAWRNSRDSQVVGLVGHTALFRVLSPVNHGRIWKMRSLWKKVNPETGEVKDNVWSLENSPGLQNVVWSLLNGGEDTVKVLDHPLMFRGKKEKAEWADATDENADTVMVLAVPFWQEGVAYHTGAHQKDRDPKGFQPLKVSKRTVLGQNVPDHILGLAPEMVQRSAAERRRHISS